MTSSYKIDSLVDEQWKINKQKVITAFSGNKYFERDSVISWYVDSSVSNSSEYKLFSIWDALKEEKFWDAINRINLLYKQGETIPCEKEVTNIIYSQILSGGSSAIKLPYVSYLWSDLIPNVPFNKFISNRQVSTGINYAFWKLLGSFDDSFVEDSSYSEELNKIMGFENFESSFDFDLGVYAANKLPDFLPAVGLNIIPYMSWLKSMYKAINNSDLSSYEKPLVKGKVFSPILNYILEPSNYYDEGQFISFKDYIENMSKGDILNSTPVQNILSHQFSKHLVLYYLGSSSTGADQLYFMKDLIPNHNQIIKKAYSQVSPDNIEPSISKDFLPSN